MTRKMFLQLARLIAYIIFTIVYLPVIFMQESTQTQEQEQEGALVFSLVFPVKFH